ncbi:MAG: lipopolysaccharide biosynthesis protein, partial [Flavobacteriales bacterium]
NGFLFYPLVITAVGSVLFLCLYASFKDDYLSLNEQPSELLSKNIFYLLPLTFFLGIFNILDAYTRALLLSTAGVLVKEVLLRIVILAAALAYHWNWMSFDEFLLVYFGSFCAMSIAMIVILKLNKQWHIQRPNKLMTANLKKEVRDVAIFSVITGLSGMMISSIDKVLVNEKLGLAAAGIFSVATYFGSMIQIPARSVMRISSSVIADSWKKNDLNNIAFVYRQSCLNQLIIGLLFFMALWVNIDHLIALMPAEYAPAKYVIFFMALGYLVDLATGANGAVISTSQYYRYDTLFMLILVVMTFITNLSLIPVFGIVGSGIASFITYLMINSMRIIFIRVKFKIHPYSWDFVKVFLIGLSVYLIVVLIPNTGSHYIDIIIKGSLATTLYLLAIVWFRVQSEFRELITKALHRLPFNKG